jgi:hypothetical protein
MNERIKELAEQAGAETWSRAPMRAVTGLAFTDENLEKFAELIVREFAELIVRECADICIEMATKCAGLPGDGALAKDCADWIKRDFGVEE